MKYTVRTVTAELLLANLLEEKDGEIPKVFAHCIEGTLGEKRTAHTIVNIECPWLWATYPLLQGPGVESRRVELVERLEVVGTTLFETLQERSKDEDWLSEMHPVHIQNIAIVSFDETLVLRSRLACGFQRAFEEASSVRSE